MTGAGAETGRYTGINGKVQPQLAAAKAGAFERWRLINGGTGESMRMRLYRLDPSRRHRCGRSEAEEQIAWRERYCIGPAAADVADRTGRPDPLGDSQGG